MSPARIWKVNVTRKELFVNQFTKYCQIPNRTDYKEYDKTKQKSKGITNISIIYIQDNKRVFTDLEKQCENAKDEF